MNIIELSQKIAADRPVLDLIAGKNCILLLGNTGSGKTTTVNFLNGVRLIPTVKDFGSGIIQNVIEVDREQEGCGEIGHAMDSQTKSIFAYELKNSAYTEQELFLVDSCGFEDTEGSEVDISNAISLRNAMKTCFSLRPVVLVNASSIEADRGGGFKKLLSLITRFFSPIKDFIDAITFLFTHCEANLRYSDLRSKVLKLKISEQIKCDPNLSLIVTKVANFLDIFKEQVILRQETIAPADPSFQQAERREGELLNLILQKMRPIDAEKLMNLCIPLTDEAIKHFESMCLQTRLTIQTLLDEKPLSEFRKILDNLDSLKILQENVDLAVVSNQFEFAKTTVLQHFEGDPNRKEFPGLVNLARKSLSGKKFELFSLQMNNLDLGQCLKSYKHDIDLIYKALVHDLNTLVKDLATPLISQLDTDSGDVFNLDCLLSIQNNLLRFLLNENKQAYHTVLQSIDGRATDRHTLLQDCLRQFKAVVDGNFETTNRTDVYLCLTETSRRDEQPQLFENLFDHLERQRSLQNLQTHVKPEWCAYYENAQEDFCEILSAVYNETLGSNGLVCALKNYQISDTECSRLFHLHAIADACLQSRADDHLNAEHLFGFHNIIVNEVKDVLLSLVSEIGTLLTQKKFRKIYFLLWIIQKIKLNNGAFTEIQTLQVFNTEKNVISCIQAVLRDCTSILQGLNSRDFVHKEDYDPVIASYSLLQEAASLDPLLCSHFQNNSGDEFEIDFHNSNTCMSLIKSMACQEWTTRFLDLSHFIEKMKRWDSFVHRLHHPTFEEDVTKEMQSFDELLQQKFIRLDQMVSLRAILTEVDANSCVLKSDIENTLQDLLSVDSLVYELSTLTLSAFIEVLSIWIRFFPIVQKSMLFSNLDFDQSWSCVMREKLVQRKGNIITSVVRHIVTATEQSKEAIKQLDGGMLQQNLDILKNYCVLDSFIQGKKPSTLYENTLSARKLDIHSIFKETETTLVKGSSGEENTRSLELVTKQRSFFENASTFQEHFPEFDFVTMACTLQSQYREALVKIPQEISELLNFSDFSSIKNKMQSVDGREFEVPSGTENSCRWSPQDREIFRACDSIVSKFFERCKREIQECLSKLNNHEEAIKFLKEKLSIAQKARVMKGLTTENPLLMLQSIFQTCKTIYQDIERRIKNSLTQYKFRAASSLCDLICTLDTFDSMFEVFHLDSFSFEQPSQQLKTFSELNQELFENVIEPLNQKLLVDCEILLSLKQNSLAMDENDSSNAATSVGKAISVSETILIDASSIRKLKKLYRAVNEIVNEDDQDTLFHGRIQFEEIKDKLETVSTDTITHLHSQIQNHISQLNFAQAEHLLVSMERLAGFINEFDNAYGSQVLQQHTDQRAAVKIARACSEVGMDADMFSFIPEQVSKLKKYLNALKMENYCKFVEAQRKIKNKFELEARELGLGARDAERNTENFERIFEFMCGLQLYEKTIQFVQNDDASKRLSHSCKRHFQEFIVKLYNNFNNRLREGRNIQSAKDELCKFVSIATESMEYMQDTLGDFVSRFTQASEQLIVLFNEQITVINAAKKGLQDYDLFALQDMEQMVETLTKLERQRDEKHSSHSPLFGETFQQPAASNFEDILEVIRAQLRNAPLKVNELLNCDYSSVPIALSNVCILQTFKKLEQDCMSVKVEIVNLLHQRQTSILSQFTNEFQTDNFTGMDSIIAEASKFDKTFMDKFGTTFESLMEKIKVVFRARLEERFAPDQRKTTCTDHHAFLICEMKSMVSKISSAQIQEIVDTRIGAYIKELSPLGVDFYDLGTSLVNQGTSGEEVAERYPEFKAVKTKRLNEAFKSAGINIGHALQELQKGPFNLEDKVAKNLKSLFDDYEALSNVMLQQYLPGFNGFQRATPLTELVRATKSKAKSIQPRSKNARHSLLEVLAGVFAVWTVQTSQQMFQSRSGDEDCLIRPNVVQMLALFRLLGLDCSDGWFNSFLSIFGASADVTVMEGHLIQVGTGEGKSILLGGLSCVLALLGYEVSCASYSKHLSKRDYEAFKPLFEEFGVELLIKYSTLSDLAEHVINSNGDIRDLVKQRILSCPVLFQIKPSYASSKRILIIDEVDVFFSEDFYGVTHNPVAPFASEATKAIIEHIWIYKGTKPTLKNIQELPAYKELLATFIPEAKGLIDNEIRFMLLDVQDFSNPPYVVVDSEDGGKLIGYKSLDSVDTRLKHRYKTAFAYLHEVQRYPGLKHNLASNLEFHFPCGSFSYAEIPRMFACIMGVTGTLTSLSDAENDVINKNYNISKRTIMPSIYGKSKLKFFFHDVDVVVELDLDRYYQLILKDIMEEREKGRAVLVFFESEGSLNDFLSSGYGGQLLDVNVVTEKTENIPFYVSKATNSKEVTLFPKVFGRGLDFVSRDRTVNSNGGVHVIQTFFSDYKSEEVQIMGRTARQAKEGSFRLIIFQESLLKYGLSKEELAKIYPSATFYKDVLQTKRNERILAHVSKLQEAEKKAKRVHNEAMQFVKDLHDRSVPNKNIVDKMMDFQKPRMLSNSVNTAPTHIIFCLDESGSMSNDWPSVIDSFKEFLQIREDLGAFDDLVSVVQFSNSARVTMEGMPLAEAMQHTDALKFRGGGTLFVPALTKTSALLALYPSYDAVVVFMTDGECSDRDAAPGAAVSLPRSCPNGNFTFYGISFKESVETLQQMTEQIKGASMLPASDFYQLREQFKFIAKAVAT